MTRNIFLLSIMAPLEEGLRKALSREILKRGTEVAYVSSSPQEGERLYYQSTIADYAAISSRLNVDYFDLSDAFTNEMLAALTTYAAIYLSGGNTFTFTDGARKRGLKKILEQHLANGGVLIGSSAGSVMCTPSIEIAGYEDKNEVGMVDFTGFDFVDFEFLPHFTGTTTERARLDEYQQKHEREIYACRDGAGIHVIDSKIELFGAAGLYSISQR